LVEGLAVRGVASVVAAELTAAADAGKGDGAAGAAGASEAEDGAAETESAVVAGSGSWDGASGASSDSLDWGAVSSVGTVEVGHTLEVGAGAETAGVSSSQTGAWAVVGSSHPEESSTTGAGDGSRSGSGAG
jgi:hypothetical protein